MTKEQKALLSWMIVMLLLLAVVGTAAFTVPAFLEAERVIYVEKPGTAAKAAGEATTPSVPKGCSAEGGRFHSRAERATA